LFGVSLGGTGESEGCFAGCCVSVFGWAGMVLRSGVTKLRGLKGKRYAVVEVRMKALETQGYLAVAGERDTKQGYKTPIFKMTAKANLAWMIGPRTIDDIVREVDEETALILFKTVSKLFKC